MAGKTFEERFKKNYAEVINDGAERIKKHIFLGEKTIKEFRAEIRDQERAIKEEEQIIELLKIELAKVEKPKAKGGKK